MPQPYGYAIFDMPPNSDFSSFDTLNDCLPGNCISLFESRFIQTKKSRVRKADSGLLGLMVIMDTILGNSLENVPLM